MIKAIIRFFKKRKLIEQIRQCSFNLESMEMADDVEWEELGLCEKWNEEFEKKRSLVKELSNL